QLARGLLAAARAGHALMDPALAAAAAQQHSRSADERLAGVGQVRELRQAAAAGTAAFGGSTRAGVAGRGSQSLEHGRGGGPRQVRSERMALDELPGPAAAPGPGLGRHRGDGKSVHQIFSMFTRNALNSGVRELASPTNGVSALASQLAPLVGSRSAAMPTKPQWIGIPM